MTLELSVRKDLVFQFGDRTDGVIGIPALTHDGQVIEISYFYGTAKPKSIIVLSSQAGCPMKCSFCELGYERFGRNLEPEEIRDQLLLLYYGELRNRGISLESTPHKVTIANTGEPLLNPSLIQGLELVAKFFSGSFKVSTVFPANEHSRSTFVELAQFAARNPEPVQLQISLISTSEEERQRIAGPHVANFQQIREAAEAWRQINPQGRKINLSVILTETMPCDVEAAMALFPPDLFRFRFRQYVPTETGKANNLKTVEASRFADIKQAFADREYEVGDWATPTPIEWKFGLAGNVIRRMYLDMVRRKKYLE